MPTIKLKRNAVSGTSPTTGQLVAGELALNTEDAYLYAENNAGTAVNRIGTTSDRVKYLGSGTGAVATTVQAKLRESVSIKDFGAVCDGITDDTAAIQAAVNSSLSVFIPEGDCLIQSWVTLRAGSHVYGAGMGRTRVIAPRPIGESLGAFYANSGSADTQVGNITLQDFELDGQVSTLLFSEFRHLISLNGVRDVIVERVKFTGFRGDGLYLGSGISGGDERHNTTVMVRDCIFDGVNSDNRNGISVIDGDNIHILNNTFRNCTRSTMPGPIDVEPNGNPLTVIRNINISSNSIESYGGSLAISCALSAGVLALKLSGLTIKNNYITGAIKPGVVGIFITTNEAVSSTLAPMGVTVTGNVIKSLAENSITPIVIRNIRGIRITNNTIINGTSTAIGELTNASLTVMDAVISGNHFYKSGNVHGAVIFASVSNIEFEGNVIQAPANDTATIGMRFLGTGVITTSNHVKILNNTFIKGAAQTISIGISEHTIDATTNTQYGNRDVGGTLINQFKADYGSAELATTGTFTPVMTVTGLTLTQVGSGSWTRLGNLVFITWSVTISAISGTGSSGVTVTGLPVASNAVTGLAYSVVNMSNLNLSAPYSSVRVILIPNSTTINLRQEGNNVGDASLSYSALTATTSLSGSFMYQA